MALNLSSSRRSRSRLSSHATINVTSLLDITMVLLISFMIIAPTLRSGITMDLPEVEDSTAVDTKETSVVVSVSVEKGSGKAVVRVDDETVAIKDLRETLADLHKARPKASLLVQGDKSVPWQDMAEVIGAVQASGMPGMSLLTVPRLEEK